MPGSKSRSRSRSSSRSSTNSSRSTRSSATRSSAGASSPSPARQQRKSRSDVARSAAPAGMKSDAGRNGREQEEHKAAAAAPAPAAAASNMLQDQPLGRTGGVYIPPFKLARMQQEMAQMGKATKEYQKLTWEALRKAINGLINKVNVTNIRHIVQELFQENLVRGRGLFTRAVMKAQLASPGFTHIYAALVAVINTKLPENGELVLKRVIFAFRRAYKRRDKIVATALAKFIAHLVNHQVAHELLALQLLTVLLEEPTDDSVEIAVNFTKEVGQILDELSPQGLHAVFERFRGILHEGDIDKRVQYTIEGLFAVRKSAFADYPMIPPELDLVEREDQITFDLALDSQIDKEEMLDVFRFDPDYEQNEQLWTEIKREIVGGSDDEDEDDEEDEEDDDAEGGEAGAAGGAGQAQGQQPIQDLTEQDLINMRRTIYLTIMSSVSFEECAHKLLKLNIPPGQELELCNLIVDCCAQEKSYLRYYGLLGQRFCMIHKKWQDSFDQTFLTQYTTIHRLETNKLRNVAKFFAHLLATDALPWTCLEYIRLNEDETTSSSRIFIKILMQELSEALGLAKLKERFSDPYMQDVFSGLFPRDNPRNTRFAINFFTSIGLGGLTEGLREHLKNAPKLLMQKMQAEALRRQAEEDTSSSSSDSSDSDSSDSDSDSSDSSDSSSSGSSDSDSSDSESDSGSSVASSKGRRTKKNKQDNKRSKPSEADSRAHKRVMDDDNSRRVKPRHADDRADNQQPRSRRESDDVRERRNERARSSSRDRRNSRRSPSPRRDRDQEYKRRSQERRDRRPDSRERTRDSSRDRKRERSHDRAREKMNDHNRDRERERTREGRDRHAERAAARRSRGDYSDDER